jgi:hypothetical protein
MTASQLSTVVGRIENPLGYSYNTKTWPRTKLEQQQQQQQQQQQNVLDKIISFWEENGP